MEITNAPAAPDERDKALARELIGNVNNYSDEHTGELSISAFGPLSQRIATALATVRAEVWQDASQKLRDKAQEWREQAERWQKNAESAGMDIIREQDVADRDVCLSKMSAAMTLAIEFDESARARGITND